MYRIITLFLFLIAASVSAQSNNSGNASGLSGSMLAPANAISVTIGGSFIVNGTFPALPYERVDQFITRIYTQQYALMAESRKDVGLGDYAKRSIILKRSSGQEMLLDLDKFRLTGDFKNNPYLKNEDLLIFPRIDLDRDFVSIDGAVNNAIKFPFMEGDRLSDALMFAQGINQAYEKVSKAEIMRSNYNGTKDETIVVDINSDVPLRRADRIRILADETDRKDYNVMVVGEVLRPGVIAITKDNTTVQDVIRKAGGFKPTASLANSELIRGVGSYEMLKKSMFSKSNLEFEALMMQRMSYLTEEDTNTFKMDDQLRLLRGNGLVDFSKLSTDTTQAHFRVKNGDVIIVPQEERLIYVYGQVGFPGYVEFQPGRNVRYYIDQAGGLGELARDYDEISIIKAKTRKWVTVGEKNVTIEPGDYIWVPKKTPRTFGFYLQRVSTIAAVVGSVATLVLLFTQFKK